MSGYPQKPRRNLIIDSLKPQELYNDSNEEPRPHTTQHIDSLTNEDCRAINELFQKAQLPLTPNTKRSIKVLKNREEHESEDKEVENKPKAKNLKRLR